MPVSKHRRRSETRKPRQPPVAAPPPAMSIDELRRAVANPALDFGAKTVIAGVWWFQQLLLQVGDHWQVRKASRKDKQGVAALLCVAMDGEHAPNDTLAPQIAAMLRPFCPAPTFVEGLEQAKQMLPGTVRATAAKILSQPGKPA